VNDSNSKLDLKIEARSVTIDRFVTLAASPSKIYLLHVILPSLIAVTGKVVMAESPLGIISRCSKSLDIDRPSIPVTIEMQNQYKDNKKENVRFRDPALISACYNSLAYDGCAKTYCQ
jgi:hypothetical protein